MKSWYQSGQLEANADALFQAVSHGMQAAPEAEPFLRELWLLHTLPTEYLVCDEALLPAESLRFFLVDEGWVDCLLDGALSLGRNSTLDARHDLAVRQNLTKRFHAGQNHMRSGFLLRSELVRAWPGMSISCFADSADTLECQTVTQIGDDILLCIVNGCVKHLKLTLPEEGIAFGFTWDETGALCLPLSPLPAPEIDTDTRTFQRARDTNLTAVAVPFRQQAAQGVVDIEALSDSIGKTLGNRLSALEFSAELLQTPDQYSIKGELL